MVQIELSYTWGSDEPTLIALVDAFCQQTGIKVNLRRLDWSTAWVDLFTMVSQGRGSDVSAIGSTWVSTLAKLDALRPLKAEEVEQVGGSAAFMAPLWKSTKLFGDQRAWSIPWIGWTYFIYYRKDLLCNIGLDPESAFATPENTQASLLALKDSSLEIPWLNADVTAPYVDFLHTAAPWVWTAGGEFINPSGDKVLFDSPKSIAGLVNWVNTYRYVAPQHQALSVAECRDLIHKGRAAAAVVDVNTAHTILHEENSKIIGEENVGFANLTDIPWMGGVSFVIWEHTHIHPERERAALELVKFLSSKASNLRYVLQSDLLPTRMDALNESYQPGNPLRESILQAATDGRSYYNVSHWRRVEAQLALELGRSIQTIRENPTTDVATVLQNHLTPLAKRLNMVLEK